MIVLDTNVLSEVHQLRRCSSVLHLLLAGLFVLLAIGVPLSAQIEASSSRVREKIAEIEKGSRQAILDLGKMNDPSAIPYLRVLRSRDDGGAFGAESTFAQMALAKLGEEPERNQILTEANSAAPRIQGQTVRKLEYLADKDAIRTLIGLLAQDKFRAEDGYNPNQPGRRMDRVIFEPLNLEVMKTLARIVIDPPVDPKQEPTQSDVALWRKWFVVHEGDLR